MVLVSTYISSFLTVPFYYNRGGGCFCLVLGYFQFVSADKRKNCRSLSRFSKSQKEPVRRRGPLLLPPSHQQAKTFGNHPPDRPIHPPHPTHPPMRHTIKYGRLAGTYRSVVSTGTIPGTVQVVRYPNSK